MRTEDTTVKQMREITDLLEPKSSASHSIPIGKSVLIRTSAHYYIGFVEAVTDSDIVLSSASWVADTDRWNKALTTGVLSDIEPFLVEHFLGRCLVFRGGCIDLREWTHPLPEEVL